MKSIATTCLGATDFLAEVDSECVDRWGPAALSSGLNRTSALFVVTS
jgi:hypothetical protein